MPAIVKHRIDPRPIGERRADQRLHQEEAFDRSAGVGPRLDRGCKSGGQPVAFGIEQCVDQRWIVTQQAGQRARPAPVAILLPEQGRRAVGIDENMRIDCTVGQQWRAKVMPRTRRMIALGKPDRQAVVEPPRGIGQPIFAADTRHFGGPEITDFGSGQGPCGIAALRKHEPERLPLDQIGRTQDRKRIGGIVRCRDQMIIVTRLEHRRIAIAAQDLRRQIGRDQRLPVRSRGCLGLMIDMVRTAGSVIGRDAIVKGGVIVLVAAGDAIGMARPVCGNDDQIGGVAVGQGFDNEDWRIAGGHWRRIVASADRERPVDPLVAPLPRGAMVWR